MPSPRNQFTAPFAALWGALRDGRRQTWLLAMGYFASALTVLAGVAALVDALGGGLRRWLQVILFPGELQPVAELALDVVFHTQSRALTANLTATAGLAVVSLVLFFVKEALSRSVEADFARVTKPPADDASTDLPWWREALEELGLLAIYGALFVIVFAVGQSVDPTRRAVALFLSWLVLFWTWAVDFIAPALFRRRIGYRGVFLLIARHPVASLVFGALVSLPLSATSLLLADSALAPTARMIVTVSVQAAFIILATLGGTRLGLARLFAESPEKRLHLKKPWHPVARIALAATTLGVLAVGLHTGAGVARAIVAKSQILKCSWSFEPGTMKLDLPEADPIAWLAGHPVVVGLGVDLVVHNPTAVDVAIEPTHIDVADGAHRIATTMVEPMRVAAGERLRSRIQLKLSINPDVFLKGASIDPRKWSVALYVKLENGLDFPVPLVVPSL